MPEYYYIKQLFWENGGHIIIIFFMVSLMKLKKRVKYFLTKVKLWKIDKLNGGKFKIMSVAG